MGECADLHLMVQSVPRGEPLQSAHSERLSIYIIEGSVICFLSKSEQPTCHIPAPLNPPISYEGDVGSEYAEEGRRG
jgi:hypothetical protein